MKRFILLAKMLFVILFLSACQQEQMEPVSISPAPPAISAIEAFENNPNLEVYDLDHLPDDVTVIEMSEEAANYRSSCCDIRRLYFRRVQGRLHAGTWFTVEPNRSFYLAIYENGVEVNARQYHNYTNSCRTIHFIEYVPSANCNSNVVVRAVMGVGYDLCAVST